MRILFITTKNTDYIRNVQEIQMLRASGNDVSVVGCAGKGYPERLFRVYTWLIFHSVEHYDEIFVGFAPQLIVPLFRKKLGRKRLTVDFFISVYDTLVNDRRKFSARSIAGHIAKFLDKYTLKYADRVIVDTEADRRYFADEFAGKKEYIKGCYDKMEVLYLKADENIYHPIDVDRPDKLKDKYICLYFGSVLPLQGVDVVLDAVRRLRTCERLYFYIIGPVGRLKDSAGIESENVEYIEWLPQDKLAEYIAMADLCLAGHFNGRIGKARRTVPGKAYIYSAAGRRMILGENSANHEVYDPVKDDVCYVPMGNDAELADMIMDCAGIEHAAREKISVIVPVYNTSKFIGECIDAVLGQNYSNIELTLVDDGSTDGSGSICDRYAELNSGRVKVVHTANRGPSAARNTGIEMASGEYILFVDGDDIISFDHVYRLYRLIEKYNADIAACGYAESTSRVFEPVYTDKTIVYNTEQALEDILYQRHIHSGPVCKLYRRNVLKNVRFPEGTLYEDTIAIPRAIANAQTIVWSGDITYGYYMRPGSTMRADYNERTFQYVKVADELLNWVREKYPELEKAAVSRFVWANIYVYIKMPAGKKTPDYDIVKSNIRRYRKAVLTDSKVRKANKTVLLLSYMGQKTLQKVYEIKCRRK